MIENRSSLRDLAIKYGTDKVNDNHKYIEIYEKYFEEIRDFYNNFLEIGVYRGDSIRMWAEYFTNSHIVGMDIPPEINPNTMYPYGHQDVFKDWVNVTIFLGDQGNGDDLEKLIQLDCVSDDELDVVVDDGSHFQYHMIKSLGFLFPYIVQGGLYIIEDICPTGRLRVNGEMWWGHSQDGHGQPYHMPEVRSDEEWLGCVGEDECKINFDNALDSVILRFIDTKEFSSVYLTEEQNKYLTENIEVVDYYQSCWQEGSRPEQYTGPMGVSNFAVFRKKE
jgi:hypothetical protein